MASKELGQQNSTSVVKRQLAFGVMALVTSVTSCSDSSSSGTAPDSQQSSTAAQAAPESTEPKATGSGGQSGSKAVSSGTSTVGPGGSGSADKSAAGSRAQAGSGRSEQTAGAEANSAAAGQDSSSAGQAGDAPAQTSEVPVQVLERNEMRIAVDPMVGFGQPQLAINPKDPKNLVYHVATNAMGGSGGFLGINPGLANYVSLDGGMTWKQADYPFPPPSQDPELELGGFSGIQVSPDGTFYTIFLAMAPCFSSNCVDGLRGAVYVTKSSDGGLSWSKTVMTGLPLDHPRLTIDQSTGNIFAVAGDAATYALSPTTTDDPNQMLVGARDRFTRVSTDGEHWTEPSRPWTCPAWDDENCPGADYPHEVAAGGLGQVHHHNLTWIYPQAARGVLAGAFQSEHKGICNDNPPCIVFQTSKDEGQSWERHVVPVREDARQYRVPGVVADPSTADHYAVAVMNSNAATNSGEIIRGKEFLVYVTWDAGETWSDGVVVSQDATKTHEKPWAVFSPKGVLGIVWRTNNAPAGVDSQRQLGDTFPYDVWATVSDDGGKTFAKALKISSKESPKTPGGVTDLFDCCSNIVVSDDPEGAYISWADWTTGQAEGIMATVPLDSFRNP